MLWYRPRNCEEERTETFTQQSRENGCVTPSPLTPNTTPICTSVESVVGLIVKLHHHNNLQGSVMRIYFTTFCCLFVSGFLLAQTSISLSVDATDAPRKILHAQETVTARPGPLTLVYPEWIPGEHGPTGPVVDVAGLHITADGKELAWRRDLVDMYAIRVTVPSGVKQIELSYDFLLPAQASGFSSGASSSANLLVLSWNHVVLYPSEPKPDKINVIPTLKLPGGWKYGTALTTENEQQNVVQFAAVPLNQLIDSPVLAGVFFKKIDITPEGGPPHYLDVASDENASLAITPEQLSSYKRLAVEAGALFGAHHFNHYDFLFTLSDQVAHFGLEHHQSSDDRVDERTLVDQDLFRAHASLLSHEFVHSWNGKYRRPEGLNVADFTKPMKDDLLWVYEGLTEYLGNILAPRSGLRSAQDYRDNLALVAARLDNEPGRTWRPLQDCADEAQLLYNSRGDWSSWRRGADFYDEGDLIWLEADVTIRELSKGTKSLDDFCKKFHGAPSTPPVTKPYTFDDVVSELNSVAPYDWQKFLKDRLESLGPRAPLGGIAGGGWKLVYTDSVSDFQSVRERAFHFTDFSYSIGVTLSGDGTIDDIILKSPADAAGLAPGMKVVAVNGRKYEKNRLSAAIREAKTNRSPIDVLATNGDFYKTYSIDYHGGLRFPHLERDASRPDLLSKITSPVTKGQ
jgi:predicted metalloprotease with PDZ domain